MNASVCTHDATLLKRAGDNQLRQIKAFTKTARAGGGREKERERERSPKWINDSVGQIIQIRDFKNKRGKDGGEKRREKDGVRQREREKGEQRENLESVFLFSVWSSQSFLRLTLRLPHTLKSQWCQNLAQVANSREFFSACSLARLNWFGQFHYHLNNYISLHLINLRIMWGKKSNT